MERFALPENLAELGGDDLSTLETEANEALTRLRGVSSPTQADIDELAAIKQFRTHVAALRAGTEGFASDLADLDAPAPVAPAPPAAVEPATAPVVPAAPAVVPAAASEPVVAAIESEPTPVVVREPDVSIPAQPARPQTLIATAANIPGFTSGSQLSYDDLATAVANKARATKGSSERYAVASIDKQIPELYDLRDKSDYQIANVLDELATPSYAEALTASGGWCAPSETLYDLYETICANPQLFSLPTFRANRGGVRWPVFEPIDFTDTVDWIWTEADDIAATGTKPCIPVPCPVFTECRLDAHGVCVTIGNFQDRGYPEQVRWFLNRVFYLHDRAESLRKLNAVIADADAATIAATFGAASAVVSALLLQVQGYRDRNGLCQGATVEAVAPAFLKELIKADIARQDFGGVGNAGLVTDATIRSWFAASGVSVRFIDFWQALTTAAPGPLTWPTTADILYYTPGSYVQFDGGTLDLGVTRDSVLNATNDFNIFTEDFYCIGRRGPRGVLVTIPVCPDGVTGGVGDLTCPVG